jgi:signal transduction histidine kinase
LRFAQVYRDSSTISAPLIASVSVQELFDNIHRLMRTQLAVEGISLFTSVAPADLLVQADARLMKQVLINLVLNAAYALRGRPQPRIHLRAQALESGRVQLEVIDNGTGIPDEVLDSIFIPFFTTRNGGTGIGLSLAKQIVYLHGGSIWVQTKLEGGTVFLLEF